MRYCVCVAILILAIPGVVYSNSSGSAVPAPHVADHIVMENTYPQPKVEFAGGVTALPNLVYATIPGYRPLQLDLYLPPKNEAHAARPLVMYIHGGGWRAGHARQSGAFSNWPAALASIAARGYVVASVNYRLSGEALFPAAEQDVKAAIRWLRAHAGEYGIDKSKAIVWGASAGGHLAALTAVSCGVKALEPTVDELRTEQMDVSHPTSLWAVPEEARESDCVQGAIIWYGVFDLTSIASQRPKPDHGGNAPADDAVSTFLGCGDQPCSKIALKEASPVTYINTRTPPFQIVFGSKDSIVPPAQSREFYKHLRAAGVPATLTVIPDANHSFIGPDDAATKANSIKAFEMAVRFIDETIGEHAAK